MAWLPSDVPHWNSVHLFCEAVSSLEVTLKSVGRPVSFELKWSLYCPWDVFGSCSVRSSPQLHGLLLGMLPFVPGFAFMPFRAPSALPAQGLFFIQFWILWKTCFSLLCKKLNQIGLFTFCISTTRCSFLTVCTYSAKKHQGEEEKSDVPCRKRKVLHLVSQWIALYKDWLHEDEHSKMFLKVFLQFQVFWCWVTGFIFIYMIQKNLIFSHSGFACESINSF